MMKGPPPLTGRALTNDLCSQDVKVKVKNRVGIDFDFDFKHSDRIYKVG